ncbi:hypothetical protein HZB78_02115 [Candidatus Collierbacteria bacterium]|nr:hypothetical protein [Candidatus Collierbacteria bacterium]
MNFVEQWLADRKLETAVKNLDLANGIPENADPILEAYLHNLGAIESGVREVTNQPEKVFNGSAKGLVHAYLRDIRQDCPRNSPPRKPKQAELAIVSTRQVEPTLTHITQIAAASLNIEPKDQADLVNKTLKSLGQNHRRYSSVEINPDWELHLAVDYSAGDDSWVTSFMVPVEKDYSNQLITKNSKKLKEQIRPETLKETVEKAAQTNFCVTDVRVAELDPFDLGGDRQVEEIIISSGYREITGAKILEYMLGKNTLETSIFCHQDHQPDDGKAPLLGKRKWWASNEFLWLSAVVPPVLAGEIRLEFEKKFQTAADQVIKNRIAEGQKSGEAVALNPENVASKTLKLLEQDLPPDDYEDQINWLSSIVLDQTLKAFDRYPKTKDAASLLSQARKLSAAAQRLDDHLSINSDNTDVEFGLGWSPENASIVFPAAWFAKK